MKGFPILPWDLENFQPSSSVPGNSLLHMPLNTPWTRLAECWELPGSVPVQGTALLQPWACRAEAAMESWGRNPWGNSSKPSIWTSSLEQCTTWFLSLTHDKQMALFQLCSAIKSGFTRKCTFTHLICEKARVPGEWRHSQINCRLQWVTASQCPGPSLQ